MGVANWKGTYFAIFSSFFFGWGGGGVFYTVTTENVVVCFKFM